MSNRQKRRLRNYLIDRKVQLTITAVMVMMSSGLTALIGIFWYGEIRNASEVIRVNAITTLGADAATALGAELQAADQRRLILLISFAALLGVLICIYGIVMTHRIAGPLFKINKHMKDVAEGRLYGLWGLRQSDQLQDFFATFERMHGALRTRTRQDIDMLSGVLAALETGVSTSDQVPVLRRAMQAKEESLRDASEETRRIQRVPTE